MSERDEFEAWAKRQWPEAPLHRRPSGEYTAHTLEWRWEAWQAARAPQAVPALTDEPQCRTCGGRGTVNRSERVGESDFEEWEDDCPVCGGAGSAPEHVQKLQAALEAAWLDLHTLRMRVGASSLFAAAPQSSPEAITECAEIDPDAWKSLKAHAHDWRFSLQDHVYKCDCGATRGDYPFGAASFKD